MLVGRSIGIAMSTQPLIDDFSESLGYVITYPSHKIPVKSKIHAAVLHHESANILCVSVILADRRISCELVTVPVKTHGGADSIHNGLIYKFIADFDPMIRMPGLLQAVSTHPRNPCLGTVRNQNCTVRTQGRRQARNQTQATSD